MIPDTKKNYQRKKEVTSSGWMGKLPPQATDLEQAVLGAIMLVRVPNTIWGTIRPELFYKEQHQKICEAIFELRIEEIAVDILTVTARLRKRGELEMVGGAFYLTELTDRVAGSQNLEFHIAVITEKFLSRQLIELGNTVINTCYDDTSNPLAEMVVIANKINDLKKGIFKRTEKHINTLLDELDIEIRKPKIDGLIGTSCGFKGVDHITQGDQENQLIIEAGRPGMGKTASMCSQMKENGFNQKIPVACFSLEMSSVQLVFRLMSNHSEIPTLKLKKNQLNPTERIRYEEFRKQLAESKIYIDDTAGLTIDEFEAKAAIMVSLYGVKKIYIDYLQLMLGSPFKKYGNREAEVSDISRRLKQCAKSLGITIIALCQLSRVVESRKNCLPILSDLRESGSIEQDADVVRFIWRPEYYPEVIKELGNIHMDLFNFSIDNHNEMLYMIIAKCREEKTGKVPLKFKGSIMRVYDHPTVLEKIELSNANESANSFDLTFDDKPAPF